MSQGISQQHDHKFHFHFMTQFEISDQPLLAESIFDDHSPEFHLRGSRD
jgi:hypothetical protein